MPMMLSLEVEDSCRDCSSAHHVVLDKLTPIRRVRIVSIDAGAAIDTVKHTFKESPARLNVRIEELAIATMTSVSELLQEVCCTSDPKLSTGWSVQSDPAAQRQRVKPQAPGLRTAADTTLSCMLPPCWQAIWRTSPGQDQLFLLTTSVEVVARHSSCKFTSLREATLAVNHLDSEAVSVDTGHRQRACCLISNATSCDMFQSYAPVELYVSHAWSQRV
jgi:hypothetical protein